MSRATQVWFCPKCGYRTRPQPAAISGMTHPCGTGRTRVDRELKREEQGE